MKKLLLIFSLALAISAQAQLSGSFTPAVTVLTQAATNSTASDSLELVSRTTLWVYPSLQGSNAAVTGTFTFVFQASPDASTWTSTRTDWKVDVTLDGTNTVCTPAKVDAAGFRYFRLWKLEHPTTIDGNTNGVKSISVKYFAK